MTEGYIGEYRRGFAPFDQVKDEPPVEVAQQAGRISTGLAFGYAYEVNEVDFEAAAERQRVAHQQAVEASARPISATVAANVVRSHDKPVTT